MHNNDNGFMIRRKLLFFAISSLVVGMLFVFVRPAKAGYYKDLGGGTCSAPAGYLDGLDINDALYLTQSLAQGGSTILQSVSPSSQTSYTLATFDWTASYGGSEGGCSFDVGTSMTVNTVIYPDNTRPGTYIFSRTAIINSNSNLVYTQTLPDIEITAAGQVRNEPFVPGSTCSGGSVEYTQYPDGTWYYTCKQLEARTGVAQTLNWQIICGLNTLDSWTVQSWPVVSRPQPNFAGCRVFDPTIQHWLYYYPGERISGSQSITFNAPGTYTYSATARNEDGSVSDYVTFLVTGDSTTTTSTTTTTTPGTLPNPTDLSFECSSNNKKVSVFWKQVAGATSYLLRINDTTNTCTGMVDGWYCSNSTDLMTETTGGSGVNKSYKNHDINPNTPYTWWIHSKNSSGYSSGVAGPSFTCGSPPTTTTTSTTTTSTTTSTTTTTLAPTLDVALSVNPSSGPAPLTSTLTASVFGTATGTINYTFWWNCAYTGTSVATAISQCGDPDGVAGNINGNKFDGINDNPKNSVPHSYPVGTYTAKVIVERGSLAKEDRKTVTSTNGDPEVSLNIFPGDYCSGVTATAIWQYSDPNGDPQSAYQFQIDEEGSSFGSPVLDTGKILSSGNSYSTGAGVLQFNVTYKARVKVWDSNDSVSSWGVSDSWKTPKHAYPQVNFIWSPLSPNVNQSVQFTDQTTFSDSGGGSRNWSWLFGDGGSSNKQNPKHTYSVLNNYNVNLIAEDKDGYTCSNTKTITVKKPVPFWREVAPRE
ncbi:MAG: PKD domain-containing protein [Candidatus Yanofskybacteria bacterium]|nr:PKD domain-containing protein [Candidatus Yanofskybacteria bacterium]